MMTHAYETERPAVEVTRSEEELAVTTQRVPTQRVRLSKRIVTETVTVTTEVRREELVVTRSPAPDATEPDARPRGRGRLSRFRRRGPSPSIGSTFENGEAELVLMEERVEVTKRVVPRERIRLTRHTTTAHQDITGSIRKEAVSIDAEPIDEGA